MPDREKVIENLRAMSNIAANNGDIQSMRTIDDALVLLRERGPRVMTLEEVRECDDWMWVEYQSGYCGWQKPTVDGYDEEGILWDDATFDPYDVYGDCWRCWTSRSTPEQMRDTKWEEADNG